MKKFEAVNYIEVIAEVRYWEDSKVNGEEDSNGNLIPLRIGNKWHIHIDLKNGIIRDWIQGVSANVFYKVCDQGEYYLKDKNDNRLFKYSSHYVPDKMLCIGEAGYGDYIILNVNERGEIENWEFPEILDEEWEIL